MKAQQVSAALSVCSEAPFDHAWGEPIPLSVTLFPPGSKKISNRHIIESGFERHGFLVQKGTLCVAWKWPEIMERHLTN